MNNVKKSRRKLQLNVLDESAFDVHDDVNKHVEGWAIKTASKESCVAEAIRAMNVTITARKAADFVGEQHPKQTRFHSLEFIQVLKTHPRPLRQ